MIYSVLTRPEAIRTLAPRRVGRSKVIGLLLAVSAAVYRTSAEAQYDAGYPEPIGKVAGKLLIVGGGTVSDAMYDRFVGFAGGAMAHIVVIPTAAEDADSPGVQRSLENWNKRNPASVTLFHTRDRDKANSPAFVEPLNRATGVWFDGGQQSRLADAYSKTAVETALTDVLRRGGVVGGTSAGAAILSRVMIASGNPIPRVAEGFDVLPGAIIDQHFVTRNRQPRLLAALAQHPGLVGFGIDESTALVVQGRSLEVMGESVVVVCVAAGQDRPARIEQWKAGQRGDLIAWSRSAVARSHPPFPPALPPAPNLSNGSLIIVGGGRTPPGLLERFVELAGGPNAPIVYIPCTPSEEIPREPGILESFRRAGAKNVAWLHTKDRTKANRDGEFLKPLETARGIWFGGGRQWNLVDSYQNTKAHHLFHQVLERGGVIGGSSAGASIQGDYMPRGDPMGNLNIIAEGYEHGLGLLTGVAIDQHFSQRNRLADMTTLVARYPQLLGIGIDESTAIVVQKSAAEVVGANHVAFYDARRPKDDDGRDYVKLKAGQRYDLQNRRVIESVDSADPKSW